MIGTIAHLLQVFMLQILLAEYLALVRREWSTNAEVHLAIEATDELGRDPIQTRTSNKKAPDDAARLKY